MRFGDPESQVVLPLLDGALGRLLASAARGELEGGAVTRGAGAVVAVALTDAGYPETVRGGGHIQGLDRLRGREGLMVFHAGTRRAGDEWRVDGGRAAYVAARAATRQDARARVYAALAELEGAGWRARGDIAAEGGVCTTAGPTPRALRAGGVDGVA